MVRPATTAEVAEVVTICRAAGIAIVPQGGNTGLVGGSVPLDGEVVLSLERVAAVEDVNDLAGQVTVGAGASLAAVQRAATEHGWAYGVDIAGRDSATVGGMVATNAGGLRVVRYGDTRQQLTGLEMVTGAGATISELSGVLRNNTGYNLPALACGSEGTLGVITRARLRLVPAFSHRSTALIRFADPNDAAVAAESLRRDVAHAESVELFFGNGMELVCDAFGLQPPFADTTGGYVLVEAADVADPTPILAAAVNSLDGVSDVAVANDTARRAALWRYRERHTDAIATLGIPHKLDVAVPPGAMVEFLGALPEVIRRTAPTRASSTSVTRVRPQSTSTSSDPSLRTTPSTKPCFDSWSNSRAASAPSTGSAAPNSLGSTSRTAPLNYNCDAH